MKKCIFSFIVIMLSVCLYNCGGAATDEATETPLDERFNQALKQDPQRAKHIADSLLGETGDSAVFFCALSYKALSHLALYELDSVFDCTKTVERGLKHLKRSDQATYKTTMRNVCNAKGIAYSYIRKPDSAVKYLKEVLKYEEPRNIPQAYLNIADNLNQSGKYVEAAECYRHTLTVNDSLGKIVRPDIIYNGLAMSYLNISAFYECEQYLDKAKALLSEMSDYDKYILYNNYGNLFYYKTDYARSRANFAMAYDHICKIAENPVERIVPLYNLAEIHILMHQPDMADRCLDTIARSLKGTDIPVFEQHLRTLELALETERSDLRAAGKVVSAFQDGILPPDLERIRSKYLQIFYEKSGRYKEAYHLAERNYKANDSIQSSHDKTRISDIYLRYQQDTTLINRQNEIKMKDEQLHNNRLFWSIVALSLLILLIVILFISARQRNKMIAKHLDNITKLRMANIRNCLSPHFTFNVINHEIAEYDCADPRRKNLMSLSQMLRRCVELSSKMTVSLEEELDFVEAYVQLECDKWRDDFRYELNIEEGIDIKHFVVPSMFIQIPVENAIKHGLRGVDSDRMLKISIARNNGGVKISIENNGLKYQPQMISTGTGTGMKVIYQTILFLNRRNSDKITFAISEGDNSRIGREGTRVEIFIPSAFTYPVFSA